MKLTKKKAIEICKELWAWCEETGGDKRDWPKWAEYGKMLGWCPLCEYSEQKREARVYRCGYCAYFNKFSHCHDLASPYRDWIFAKTRAQRKEAAGRFLEQLNQL